MIKMKQIRASLNRARSVQRERCADSEKERSSSAGNGRGSHAESVTASKAARSGRVARSSGDISVRASVSVSGEGEGEMNRRSQSASAASRRSYVDQLYTDHEVR